MDMANAIIWDQINEDVEDAEIQNHIGVDVLPKRDPFELSDKKFIKMFRLTKALTRQLIDIMQHHVQPPSRASALTVETKVLATLRFLATGSYQEITGSNHFIGISQASVSRCLREICNVLNSPEIFNQWVRFPGNIGELENIRQSFYEKYQFPGIVGIIDCTHVAIVSPKVHNEEQPERAYVNRKNYHSLNVQLICDSTLRILNVNARFPGSTHDAFIWSQSPEAGVPEPQEEDGDIAEIDYGIYAPMPLAGEQINNARVNHNLLAARELRMNIINNHFRV